MKPSACLLGIFFIKHFFPQCKCKIEANEDAAIAFDAVSELIKNLANYKASTVLEKHRANVSSSCSCRLITTY